jgi:hypothetical protein
MGEFDASVQGWKVDYRRPIRVFYFPGGVYLIFSFLVDSKGSDHPGKFQWIPNYSVEYHCESM